MASELLGIHIARVGASEAPFTIGSLLGEQHRFAILHLLRRWG